MCCFGHTTQHVGSSIPDQESHLHPCSGSAESYPRGAGEVPQEVLHARVTQAHPKATVTWASSYRSHARTARWRPHSSQWPGGSFPLLQEDWQPGTGSPRHSASRSGRGGARLAGSSRWLRGLRGRRVSDCRNADYPRPRLKSPLRQ